MTFSLMNLQPTYTESLPHPLARCFLSLGQPQKHQEIFERAWHLFTVVLKLFGNVVSGGASLLGIRKPPRIFTTIPRKTSIYFFSERFWRELYKENGLVGLFQRTPKTPLCTERKRNSCIHKKQSYFARPSLRLHITRRLEQASSKTKHDKFTFCGSLFQGKQVGGV